MPKLGVHVSIAGGVDKAFARAADLNCDTMQIFTKNNNQWKARELKDDEVARYHQQQAETGIEPVVTHASYLINLGTPKDPLWEKSVAALMIELKRCEMLGIPYLVLHPGAHVKSGTEAGIQRVSAAINQVHRALPDINAKIALEITAGQGTTLGSNFAELASIIEGVDDDERVVSCFDTCHALAAGYDFRNETGYQAMMAEFDETIGLQRLAVLHLNDSKKDLGSRVDRHTHIGEGFIGLAPFGYFLNDPRLKDRPFLLETPQDVPLESDAANLAKLKGLLNT